MRKANQEGSLKSIKENAINYRALYRGYPFAIAGTVPYSVLSLPMYNF